MKFLKITLVVLTFFGIAGSAMAQESSSAKMGPTYTARFDHEIDDGVMANLAKVKQDGVGYRFAEGSSFGVQIKNGVQVGFKIRFF